MAGTIMNPLAAVQNLLLYPHVVIDAESLSSVPDAKGAYALILCLATDLDWQRIHSQHCFGAGYYIYAGSANGPGGLRARLRRHFRREKQAHWHVDELTMAAAHIMAVAVPGGTECDIVARLQAAPYFSHALAGFGSSDCTTCCSHLLEYRRNST